MEHRCVAVSPAGRQRPLRAARPPAPPLDPHRKRPAGTRDRRGRAARGVRALLRRRPRPGAPTRSYPRPRRAARPSVASGPPTAGFLQERRHRGGAVVRRQPVPGEELPREARQAERIPVAVGHGTQRDERHPARMRRAGGGGRLHVDRGRRLRSRAPSPRRRSRTRRHRPECTPPAGRRRDRRCVPVATDQHPGLVRHAHLGSRRVRRHRRAARQLGARGGALRQTQQRRIDVVRRAVGAASSARGS